MSTVATVDMADESTNTLEPEQHLLNAIDRQRKTLTNLRESKERLTALSKSIHAVEVNDGQAFLRAARTAKQLQNDLNEISRRIANVKKTLEDVQRIDNAVLRNGAQ